MSRSAAERIADLDHDRKKAHVLDPDDPVYRTLGGNAAKRRQVDAFLRALDATIGDSKPERIVDLGCGNAYLTFAAYRFLETRGIHAERIGVDIREDQRIRNEALAAELGWSEGIRFVAGTILEAPVESADVVLALHACDTATDEALARAIEWQGAEHILAAPCCHHDLAAQLRRHHSPLVGQPILRERFADVLTDTLRGLILRQHGYKVEIAEFIDSAHTPRNRTIRATRVGRSSGTDEYTSLLREWPFFLGHRHVPVQSVGAYIPGGKYPLTASAHMTIVTAKVAGVPRVIACTPPIHGEIPAATVAAMSMAGADEIWILGGVQAVAAMALGTETSARVDLIAGPGNAYVAEAKRQLFGEVGIDLLAGPTEILIVADEAADPFVVAVDLLSQAEHGPESPAILITTSAELGREVIAHVDRILPDLPTADYAGPAWRDFGQVIVVGDLDEAYALADSFASEHVQILTSEPRRALDAMHHYGALFLGENTCVSYGDKVIGTNHVLPTRGAARYTGGLWVGKYLRTVTYQEVRDDAASGELGRVCGRAARVELFEGHARSGDVRAARHLGDRFEWIDALASADHEREPEPAGQ